MPITDTVTGAGSKAEIFVLVFGASSLTHAEATWTQTRPEWIGAHFLILGRGAASAAPPGEHNVA